MKNVAILGSTGSVGSSSLEVLRANKNEFEVKLLVANKNYESLINNIESSDLVTFIFMIKKRDKNSYLL